MTNTLSTQAKLMIGAVACVSLTAFGLGGHDVRELANPQFFLLLVASVLTSRLKVKLPGVMGNMSGNTPVIVLAVLRLSLTGSLLVAATAAIVQCYASGSRRPQPVQFLFNACVLVNSASLAYWTFHFANTEQLSSRMLMLVVAAVGYFLANTIPVAGIIALTEHSNPFSLWRQVFLWSFPNYVIGAGLAGIASVFGANVAWQTLIALMAVLFSVYQCYKVFVSSAQTQPQAMAHAAAAGR